MMDDDNYIDNSLDRINEDRSMLIDRDIGRGNLSEAEKIWLNVLNMKMRLLVPAYTMENLDHLEMIAIDLVKIERDLHKYDQKVNDE